ncbi:MAG: 1-acyl-sn-glycerol-3-phosphate acyltransferase [Rickettsiales bacterium]|jgi:1-acyl-sn-glycerol-3-phosphate acyltransferase
MIKKKISYSWRVLRAGFCFAIFGIGALILFFIIFPFINLFTKKKSRNIRRSVHLSWRFFVFTMSFLRLISVEVKNLEALKNAKGKLIIANHPSLIDVVILIALIPEADCVVKGALANNFFMRGIIKHAYIINSINVDELFVSCRNSLQAENNLIIFPEGTRSSPGKKIPISRGAAHIAIFSKSDILPIHIKCTPPGLIKGQKWYEVADEKLNFTLEIKPEIKIEKYLDEDLDKSIRSRELTKEIIKTDIFV